jgi:DNA polymerase-4
VRLRAEGLLARTVSVQVRTSDLRSLTRSRTLPTPTDGSRELYLAARELIAGVDLGGLPVRLVGVRVEGLTAVADTIRQPTLDEAVGEPSRGRRDVPPAPDQVHVRLGGPLIGARVSQVRGVASRSTTTFVPADLS